MSSFQMNIFLRGDMYQKKQTCYEIANIKKHELVEGLRKTANLSHDIGYPKRLPNVGYLKADIPSCPKF